MKSVILKIIALLLPLFSGCASLPIFPLTGGSTSVEKIITYDARKNIDRDVDVVIYKPKVINSQRPGLIVMSGCDGGHWRVHQEVVKELNSIGVVIAEVNSIKTYGNQCLSSTLGGSARAEHAFLAKDLLVNMGLVEKHNVGLLGLSHGGWTAIHTSKMDVQHYFLSKLKNPEPFSAGVALYPWCDIWTTRRATSNPLLILAGSADTWCPVEQCEQIVRDDPNVTIHTYEGATHAWDAPFSGRVMPTHKGTTYMAYDHKVTSDSTSRSLEFFRKYLRLK